MVLDHPRQLELDWVLRVKRKLDVDGMIHLVNDLIGGDMVSTRVSKFEVHAERVVTLVKQSL